MKNASVISDEFSRGAMSEAEVSQISKSIARAGFGRVLPRSRHKLIDDAGLKT